MAYAVHVFWKLYLVGKYSLGKCHTLDALVPAPHNGMCVGKSHTLLSLSWWGAEMFPQEGGCSSRVPSLPRAAPSCWRCAHDGVGCAVGGGGLGVGESTGAICKNPPPARWRAGPPPARQPSVAEETSGSRLWIIYALGKQLEQMEVWEYETHTFTHSPTRLSRCTDAHMECTATPVITTSYTNTWIHLCGIPHTKRLHLIYTVPNIKAMYANKC